MQVELELTKIKNYYLALANDRAMLSVIPLDLCMRPLQNQKKNKNEKVGSLPQEW
jgi:hypothetical protein